MNGRHIGGFYRNGLPNNVVHMTASQGELRYCCFVLAFVPFLSALVGFGLAQGGLEDGWIANLTRFGALTAYSAVIVFIAKSRFKLWQTKGDLFR